MEPKSKTELLGLGFGERNMGEFILGQSKPYWGGLHCVLGHGGQGLGMAREGAWLEPKSQNLSRWGSVLADKTWRTSGLGREDLGGAGEA